MPPAINTSFLFLSSGKISRTYSTKTWNWSVDNKIVPQITIVLPASDDTIEIGKYFGNCINFAGYIMGTTTTLYLPDTIFSTEETPLIWSPSGTSSILPNGAVHYLSNGGVILPRSSTDSIHLSYNPMVINFGTGFNLAHASGDSIVYQLFLNDSLLLSDSTFKATLSNSYPDITPLIAEVYPSFNASQDSLRGFRRGHSDTGNDSSSSNDLMAGVRADGSGVIITTYPNPASDKIQVSANSQIGALNVQMYSLSVQLLRYAKVEAGKASIEVSEVAAGEYVIIVSNESGAEVYSNKITIVH